LLQTPLGKRFLSLRGEKFPARFLEADQLCGKRRIEALTMFGKFQHEVSLTDSHESTQDQHVKILQLESDLLIDMCNRLASLRIHTEEDLRILGAFSTETKWNNMLLGRRCAAFLFELKPPPGAVGSNGHTIPDNGNNNSSSESDKRLYAMAKFAVDLVDVELDRMKAETELASKLCQDDILLTELDEADLRNTKEWIQRKLDWMTRDIELIYKCATHASTLRAEIAALGSVSEAQLQRLISTIMGREDTLHSTGSMRLQEEPSDIELEESRELSSLWSTLVNYSHGIKDLDVAQTLIVRLHDESKILANQLQALRK
jgi:hypothetical protein